MFSTLHPSNLLVAYQYGAKVCCASPVDFNDEVHPSASSIERSESAKEAALNSLSDSFKVENTLLTGADGIRYCKIDDQIRLMGLKAHIAEWKIKGASLPVGNMPASIELTDIGIEWLPNVFDVDNILRVTEKHVILANSASKSDLAIFDRISHALLKSIALDHIVKMEVDRDEVFVFTLDANLRTWTLHCYDLSHLDTPPRILTNIFCKFIHQVFFTDKEIILNLQSCFSNSEYHSHYLIALTRYFDDSHTKLFNDADTQLNFGNLLEFKAKSLPFLVSYKDENHFIASFFIPENDSNSDGFTSERNYMQATYVSIASNGIQESFLFELNQKVWRNFTNCVGLCGDRIFVMGDYAYVVNLYSKEIEGIIPLQVEFLHNGCTDWQFLSIANKVFYLYSTIKGPLITTIEMTQA
jgi:hypothetical protein